MRGAVCLKPPAPSQAPLATTRYPRGPAPRCLRYPTLPTHGGCAAPRGSAPGGSPDPPPATSPPPQASSFFAPSVPAFASPPDLPFVSAFVSALASALPPAP